MDSSRQATTKPVRPLRIGTTLGGVVNRLTRFGILVDFDAGQGLVRYWEVTADRTIDPVQLYHPGDKVRVRVIDVDPEKQHVYLSIKRASLTDDDVEYYPFAEAFQGLSLEPDVVEPVVEQAAPADQPEEPIETVTIESTTEQVSDEPVTAEPEAQPEASPLPQVGDIIDGTVNNLSRYGIFVDIATGRALVRYNEVTWDRVIDATRLYRQGDSVRAKVISVNDGRVSLSIKQAQEKPWDVFRRTVKVGDTIKGTVCSLTQSGVFIWILPGHLDGFITVENLVWGRVAVETMFETGQEIDVRVLGFDDAKKRVRLGYKPDWARVKKKYSVGEDIRCRIVELSAYGAFVEVEPGLIGLVRVTEISHRPVKAPGEVLTVGRRVRARVMEMDSKRHRILLSIRAATGLKSTDGDIEYRPFVEAFKGLVEPEPAEPDVVSEFVRPDPVEAAVADFTVSDPLLELAKHTVDSPENILPAEPAGNERGLEALRAAEPRSGFPADRDIPSVGPAGDVPFRPFADCFREAGIKSSRVLRRIEKIERAKTHKIEKINARLARQRSRFALSENRGF